MIDLREVLLSQYANSPRIVKILNSLHEVIDPSLDIDGFYDNVISIQSANSYGLDVWGRILGISRKVKKTFDKSPVLGFIEANEFRFKPFGGAPFSGDGSNFSSYDLPDNLYRKILLIKAYANILCATAPNINKFLYYIFGGKTCYYMPYGNMSASYIFEFNPTAFEQLIIYSLNILPIPCGVSVRFIVLDVKHSFGFQGSDLQPFNQGIFLK